MGLDQILPIARTYINTVFAYIYIFSLAFASANAVLTGFNVGRRNYEKAFHDTMKIARISFIIVTCVTLIVNLFSKTIFGIFTDNEEILNIAIKVLWLAIPRVWEGFKSDFYSIFKGSIRYHNTACYGAF